MTPSATRVASRWLQAGLIEPPPKLVEAVTAWVQRETASYLLATRADVPGLADLARKYSTAPSDKTVRRDQFDLRHYLSGWKYLSLADRLRKKTLQGVRADLAAGQPLTRGQRFAVGIPNDGSVLSPRQTERALQIYASASAEDIVAPLLPSRGRDLYVTLFLEKKGTHGNAGAFGAPSTLHVNAGNSEPDWNRVPREFREYMRRLGDVIEHELIHYTQGILSALTEAQDAGLPSARTPEYQQEMDRDYGYEGEEKGGDYAHALDDIEFYTRLNDEVRNFNRLIKGMGLPEGPTAHTFWSRARKITVADPSTIRDLGTSLSGYVEGKPYGPVSPSFFFKALRRAPRKWRKAVGEFLKATAGSAPGTAPGAQMPKAPTGHSYRGTDARIRDMLANPGSYVPSEARAFLARYKKAASSFDAEAYEASVSEFHERNRKRQERGRAPRAPHFGLRPDNGFDPARQSWTGETESTRIGYLSLSTSAFFTTLRKYAPDQVGQIVEAFTRATNKGRP